MRLLVRITASPTFIYIDQGLASNECWHSSPWGGNTPRVENISRNNSRALPSQLIIPIISSALFTLRMYTSFNIAHVQSCPRSGTSKLCGPASQQPQPNVIAGRSAQVASVIFRLQLRESRQLYVKLSAGRRRHPSFTPDDAADYVCDMSPIKKKGTSFVI